jgi:MFS family permease
MRRWPRPSDPWIAAAAMFCCGWGGNQFTPLLSLYRSRDGFSEVVVDALLGAYVLGLAPALLVGGGLSDRHGRKRLMTVAMVATGLGSLLISLDDLGALAVGRLLSGVGIGLAMAVGSTWVVELGARAGLAPTTAARRASLSLTAGLGVGAGAAGVLAQFGPLPVSVPYWVHLALALPVLWLVAAHGVETVAERREITAPARAGLWPRAATDPRFRRLILPMAPWIFCAAGVAYATVPEALHAQVSSWALLYATILTVVAMAAGFLIQPLAQRLEHPSFPRSIGLTMGMLTLGMALAAATVALGQVWLGVLTAIVLGGALGLGIVSGLSEIQRLSEPSDLARTTGLFYALSYIGFLAPMLIALSGQTTAALWLLTILAAACGLFVVARSQQSHDLLGRATAGLHSA